MSHFDVVIAGGGVIGIAIGRELLLRHPQLKIVVLEKEEATGRHASGRNSGVIHAGFYYSADSLKAKLTRDGNALLTQFCEEQNLALRKCGKLVVAQSEADLAGLDELLRRAKLNGVVLEDISESEAIRIEPSVRTCQRALWSPATSSVDPVSVLNALEADFKRRGGTIKFGTKVLRHEKISVFTEDGMFECGHFINCAGLYADVIAKNSGHGADYAILPFKGLYLISEAPCPEFRTHIYPVPQLENPFLGVHLTAQSNGHIKIGPTAMPALWREQYSGWAGFNASEFFSTAALDVQLLLSSPFGFAGLAFQEFKKSHKKEMLKLAASLSRIVNGKIGWKWTKAGIRAQLLNKKTKCLEMDFIVESGENSTHVLNAVSPGFTCCLAFAKYVCDKICHISKEFSAKVPHPQRADNEAT